MAKNYYQILGVDKRATESELRQAYRKLARQYHPDVNLGEKDSESKFKEINEAYSILSDPDKRVKYDQFGEDWKHAQVYNTRQGNERFVWDMGTDYKQNSSFFGDIMGDMFRNHLNKDNSPRKRKTQIEPDQPIKITLREAFTGTIKSLNVGDKTDTKRKALDVRIPPGVDTGSRIKVTTKGTGRVRDIHLIVQIENDETFERRGNDLYTITTITLADSVLGGEVQVPTLNDNIFLRIPQETQNGSYFRLSGKGMPLLKNPSEHGNMYTKIQIQIPTNLSDREIELFEELKSIREEHKG